jgi:hypothetical protein
VNSPDPKKLRVNRPVPVTASSSLGPPMADPIGHRETETEMAAPRLDGPQHAPSLIKTGSLECEWKRGEPTLGSDGSVIRERSP